MTLRICPVCGVPEQRQRDTFGRELTNLDPISHKCVDCLIATVPVPVKGFRLFVDVPFDPKRAAANDREDR